jgi:transposase InsO family protein
MAYSKNPNLPRVRMEAVKLVRSGWSTVKVARHLGYSQSAISKWCKRAPEARNKQLIPTESSRPKSHPRALDDEIVSRIIELRKERQQCAEILHHRLEKEGVEVSLSSVKRTLKREGLTRYSKWKKWHQYPEKPLPEAPGALIQLDSMREGVSQGALHAYALIDVRSRFAFACASSKANTHSSIFALEQAKNYMPFHIQSVQSDHGSEFAKFFTKRCLSSGIEHHHSRVRTPTDNAFVERFIQTLQKDCLKRIPHSLTNWQREIPDFLRWYNFERPHMSIEMRTPVEELKLFQAID